MKLMPAIARVVKEFYEVKSDKAVIARGTIIIDDDFIPVTAFGSTATYLLKYSQSGKRIFIKDWNLKKRDSGYEFYIRQVDIVDYKEEI